MTNTAKTETTKNTKTVREKRSFSFLSVMQNIGKSLVFPIATLPAAALLLRIGAFISGFDGDAAHWIGFIIMTPGSAVFDNLPIIFGIGVAFGFARENRGEVALIGAIAYFALIGLGQNEGGLATLVYGGVHGIGTDGIMSDGTFHSGLLYLNVLDNSGALLSSTWLMNFGVFGGILTGLITAMLYNRFSEIRLHPALGFFSGRRFVPIVTLFAMIGVSFGMAIIWPWINLVLIYLSIGIATVPTVGAGLYGFLNRLLIPFGLHQVLNTYFWFQAPVTYAGNIVMYQTASMAAAAPLLGDITAFSAVVPTTQFSFDGGLTYNTVSNILTDSTLLSQLQGSNIGIYQVGFFPTMMFGLPAVAIAMACRAEQEHRKQVWAFMAAGSVVAFLTGITEPLEFSFMFISPVIYFVYSFLTGIYASITVALGASIGFGFSAGFIDYGISILSGGVSTLSHGASDYLGGYGGAINVALLGVVAFTVNFIVTYILIGKFNISTPGRNGNVAGLTQDDPIDEDKLAKSGGKPSTAKNEKLLKLAKDTIKFIGKENIIDIDNCITRVRLTVKDNKKYSDKEAIELGYLGVIKVGKQAYQLILGPDCEVVANLMKKEMNK